MGDIYTGLPSYVSGVLETYRVRPEGMSLEEWYMSQGEITPPSSDIPSGPPASWGSAVQPIVSGGTDVPYTVEQPKSIYIDEGVTPDTYTEWKMQESGFVKGTYGGWYKPETQETRPKTVITQDQEQTNNDTNGGGNGGDGETGGDASVILLLLAAGLALG